MQATLIDIKRLPSLRVKLLKGHYYDDVTNPAWGGRQGKILGTITKVEDPHIEVMWDNEFLNSYYLDDLEFVITEWDE